MPKKKNRWVAKVKTESTYPPQGLFNKSAETIARSLASKKVSPKGPGSGMRMLTFFMNRAGSGLSAERRAELEKAKSLLSKRIAREKQSHAGKKAASSPFFRSFLLSLPQNKSPIFPRHARDRRLHSGP